MGDSQIAGVWPSTLGCSITGPSCYDRYRQYNCCSLYQQTGCDPFPRPVEACSRSVSVATDSDITLRARHIPGCLSVIADRLSEPAHHNRVESPPRGRESDIQTVGNSSSGHVCHSPQHASSSVYVSDS